MRRKYENVGRKSLMSSERIDNKQVYSEVIEISPELAEQARQTHPHLASWLESQAGQNYEERLARSL
ncbi:MAG: hypothetical protein ACP5D2_03615 [Candidatus Nanoarchaeia archaeon]